MRINVYAEEITPEVQWVKKTVEDADFGKRTFYGVRVFLKSPPDLHHGNEDDDRTAITYWFKLGQQKETVQRMLSNMIARVNTNGGPVA